MEHSRSTDRRHRERGQAAVETAIVLPMMVFMLLGLLQMTLAYQARLVNEYAAFKVARAASVYRLDCDRMVRAGLMALIPTISRVGDGKEPDPRPRYLATARKVLGDNKPPNAGVSIPLIWVDYRVTNFRDTFDDQLEPNQIPMKVHVRLAYFWEYRIPFANWIISRVWLSSQTGEAWATGADPITPVRGTPGRVTAARQVSPDVGIARLAITKNYFTVPLVSTWTMRMMSDPLPSVDLAGHCE